MKFELAHWSYVFMPNHDHLIVWPRSAKYDISAIRHAIKAPVGRKAIAYLAQFAPHWRPRITRQRGSNTERLFWQSGGGYDRNIVCGRTLLKEIHYLHDNPIRKQLVLSQADWKWSSAAWFNAGLKIPLAVDPIPSEWLMDTGND